MSLKTYYLELNIILHLIILNVEGSHHKNKNVRTRFS